MIIHIGFPKTATTTLQNEYFPKLDIKYLGQPFKDNSLHRTIEAEILQKDEVEYGLAGLHFNCDNALLSYEGLCFSWDNRFDRLLVAQRLKDIFGDAKILIVIRNQITMIQSLYRQAVLGGMYLSFEKFLESFWSNYHQSFFPQLKYYELAQAYAKVFGKKNVMVVCYEDLLHSPNRFFQELSRFIGVQRVDVSLTRQNKGLSRVGVIFKHLCNRLIKYDFGRPSYMAGLRKPGQTARWSPRLLWKVGTNEIARRLGNKTYQPKFGRMEQKIKELYGESNRKLIEGFDVSVLEYSYPIGE